MLVSNINVSSSICLLLIEISLLKAITSPSPITYSVSSKEAIILQKYFFIMPRCILEFIHKISSGIIFKMNAICPSIRINYLAKILNKSVRKPNS